MRFELQHSYPSLYLSVLPTEPLSLAGGRGTEVTVLEGKVWLTEENLADDVFLFAGESYVLRDAGRAVIGAETPVRMVLRAAGPVHATRGWSSGLARIVAHAWTRISTRPGRTGGATGGKMTA